MTSMLMEGGMADEGTVGTAVVVSGIREWGGRRGG